MHVPPIFFPMYWVQFRDKSGRDIAVPIQDSRPFFGTPSYTELPTLEPYNCVGGCFFFPSFYKYVKPGQAVEAQGTMHMHYKSGEDKVEDFDLSSRWTPVPSSSQPSQGGRGAAAAHRPRRSSARTH